MSVHCLSKAKVRRADRYLLEHDSYPGGFLWIFSGVYYICDYGKDVRSAQIIFAAVYVATFAIVCRLYTYSRKVEYLSLLSSSYQPSANHCSDSKDTTLRIYPPCALQASTFPLCLAMLQRLHCHILLIRFYTGTL